MTVVEEVLLVALPITVVVDGPSLVAGLVLLAVVLVSVVDVGPSVLPIRVVGALVTDVELSLVVRVVVDVPSLVAIFVLADEVVDVLVNVDDVNASVLPTGTVVLSVVVDALPVVVSVEISAEVNGTLVVCDELLIVVVLVTVADVAGVAVLLALLALVDDEGTSLVTMLAPLDEPMLLVDVDVSLVILPLIGVVDEVT